MLEDNLARQPVEEPQEASVAKEQHEVIFLPGTPEAEATDQHADEELGWNRLSAEEKIRFKDLSRKYEGLLRDRMRQPVVPEELEELDSLWEKRGQPSQLAADYQRMVENKQAAKDAAKAAWRDRTRLQKLRDFFLNVPAPGEKNPHAIKGKP